VIAAWNAVRLLLFGLATLALTVACASAPPAAPTTAPAPAATTPAANPYLAKPDEAATPVKAAWCAISAGFVQMFVARDYDLFSKYGLSLQTSQFTDSQTALAALQSGEIDFLFCAAAATIPGLASGIDGTIVAAPLVGLPYVMVARPEIHSVADLKGRKIGINRPAIWTIGSRMPCSSTRTWAPTACSSFPPADRPIATRRC
jgi:ABC-type nitrate/sulfonate/bicarbonate transport system substrate-binding protein